MDKKILETLEQYIQYRNGVFYDYIRLLIKTVKEQEEELDRFRASAALRKAGVQITEEELR